MAIVTGDCGTTTTYPYYSYDGCTSVSGVVTVLAKNIAHNLVHSWLADIRKKADTLERSQVGWVDRTRLRVSQVDDRRVAIAPLPRSSC